MKYLIVLLLFVSSFVEAQPSPSVITTNDYTKQIVTVTSQVWKGNTLFTYTNYISKNSWLVLSNVVFNQPPLQNTNRIELDAIWLPWTNSYYGFYQSSLDMTNWNSIELFPVYTNGTHHRYITYKTNMMFFRVGSASVASNVFNP